MDEIQSHCFPSSIKLFQFPIAVLAPSADKDCVKWLKAQENGSKWTMTLDCLSVMDFDGQCLKRKKHYIKAPSDCQQIRVHHNWARSSCC